jgi:hypothetical protein
MIPLWAISGVGAAVVAGLGAFSLASKLGDAKLARAEAGWAQERAVAASLAASASETYRAKENFDRDQLDKVQADGQAKLTAALAARDAADRRAAGLRSTADTALNSLRRGTAEAPATAAECAAADTAARVFRDLFGRASDVAGVLAAYADAARISGNVCLSADEVTR